MKKYTIDYGHGIAVLYTNYPPRDRFNTLGKSCYELKGKMTDYSVIQAREATKEEIDNLIVRHGATENTERLEFMDKAYLYREDGARMLVEPIYMGRSDWNMYYCDICKYIPKHYEWEEE